MNTVRVSKNRIHDALTKNRDEHAEKWQKAYDAWRAETLAKLKKAHHYFRREIEQNQAPCGDGKSRNLRQPSFDMPPPRYLAEYDRALAQIEWSIDDYIELTQNDFRRYVLDEWDWKISFASNKYTEMAS